MNMYFKIVFLITFSFALQVECEGEYYWRPWTAGSPPEDAITGRDNRGVSYIVEAYAPNFGLFVGQAFVNQQQINVSALHVNTTLMTQTSHALKVLCSGNKDKLAWYPTSNLVLRNELLTAAVNPVTGGRNLEDEVLYIGRYVDTNLRTVHFGSICGALHLHYNYNNINRFANYYEVLIVTDKCYN